MNGPEHDQNNFEREFSRAMRHADPPATLADAVMRRAVADERPAARILAMPTRWRVAQTWAAGMVAATLLVGIAARQFHHRQERVEATRNFEVATQIEQQALDKTRERLSRSGVSLEPQ